MKQTFFLFLFSALLATALCESLYRRDYYPVRRSPYEQAGLARREYLARREDLARRQYLASRDYEPYLYRRAAGDKPQKVQNQNAPKNKLLKGIAKFAGLTRPRPQIDLTEGEHNQPVASGSGTQHQQHPPVDRNRPLPPTPQRSNSQGSDPPSYHTNPPTGHNRPEPQRSNSAPPVPVRQGPGLHVANPGPASSAGSDGGRILHNAPLHDSPPGSPTDAGRTHRPGNSGDADYQSSGHSFGSAGSSYGGGSSRANSLP